MNHRRAAIKVVAACAGVSVVGFDNTACGVILGQASNRAA